MEDIWKVGA